MRYIKTMSQLVIEKSVDSATLSSTELYLSGLLYIPENNVQNICYQNQAAIEP